MAGLTNQPDCESRESCVEMSSTGGLRAAHPDRAMRTKAVANPDKDVRIVIMLSLSSEATSRCPHQTRHRASSLP
jgi:hypothetical protein